MSNPLKLLVGLGNPGARYEDTRHNAGFWLVERFAAQHGAQLRMENKFHGHTAKVARYDCYLLKPETFMNRSGQAVVALARFYRIEPAQILVAHDEIDLPPGTVRLKQGGGAGGHNGLKDIIRHLGRDFFRLRLGVGHPGQREEVINYVLDRPRAEEQDAVDQAISLSLECLPQILAGDTAKAMNILHQRR